MSGRFQFSLRALLGLTAVTAVASLLFACGARDRENSVFYWMGAFAVLGVGGGKLSGSVARGLLVAFPAFWLFCGAVIVLGILLGWAPGP